MSIINLFRFVLCALVMLLLCSCNEQKPEAILTVDKAFTPVPAPGQKNAVAYLIIENRGEQDVQILNVETAAANVAEVHRHTYEDGVMRMRKVNHAKVPAKGQLVFATGGYHIMLLGLEKPLKAGDFYDLSIEFDNGTVINTTVPVTER